MVRVLLASLVVVWCILSCSNRTMQGETAAVEPPAACHEYAAQFARCYRGGPRAEAVGQERAGAMIRAISATIVDDDTMASAAARCVAESQKLARSCP